MADPYLYPGSYILRNKFDIHDQDKLTRKERRETLKSMSKLYEDPVKGAFDFTHVQEIHRRIFESVYPFAGEIRSVNMEKAEEKLAGASVQYALAHRVRFDAEKHLQSLNQTDWSGLKDLSRPEQMEAFAQKIIDLWQVHPFREGNTRTTMMFMHQFAEEKGFAINRGLIREHAEFVRHALVVGTFGQTEHLTRILTDARQREMAKEQAQAFSIEPLVPASTVAAIVSEEAVSERLAQSAAVAKAREDVAALAGKVFRDPAHVIEAIDKAALEGKSGKTSILKELQEHPDRFGELAGKSGMMANSRDRSVRKEATELLPALGSATDNQISIVHSIRTSMEQQQAALARRANVEVPGPSVELMSLIEKGGPLDDRSRAELAGLMKGLESRFGDDLPRVRTGKALEALSQKQGLTIKQLERVAEVLKVLDKGHAIQRAEARAQDQSRSQGQERGGPVR